MDQYYATPPPQSSFLQPPPHNSPRLQTSSPGYEYMSGPPSAPPYAPSPPAAARRFSTSHHLSPQEAVRRPSSSGYPFPQAPPPTHAASYPPPAPSPELSRGPSYYDAYHGFQPTAAAISSQNTPYHPLTQQATPPSPGHGLGHLSPYASPAQYYGVSSTPPHTPPMPNQMQQQQQMQMQPYNPYPERHRSYSYGGNSAYAQHALAQSYPADNYDMSLRPPARERSYSTSSVRSHHSHRSHHSRRSSGDYSSKDYNEDGRRKSKRQRERDAYVEALDRKPSFGDTIVMAVDVIKGAITGIGRATSLALASLGCSIAVHYNTAEKEAKDLVKELRGKYGVRAEVFGADLREYGEVRRLHAAVTTSLGHPNILFANAGLTLGKSNIKSIHDISIEDFENTWRANCGSAFLLTQLCLPAMGEKGWGRVIFCSSVAGFTGGVVGPHYASSKSALHGLIHWLSGVYCSKGITVNGVAPALIQDTKMLPGSSDELAKKIPMGVLGRPEEVAETVLWMVKTGYVTNKVVAVDGGMFVQ